MKPRKKLLRKNKPAVNLRPLESLITDLHRDFEEQGEKFTLRLALLEKTLQERSETHLAQIIAEDFRAQLSGVAEGLHVSLEHLKTKTGRLQEEISNKIDDISQAVRNQSARLNQMTTRVDDHDTRLTHLENRIVP